MGRRCDGGGGRRMKGVRQRGERVAGGHILRRR